MGNVIKSFSPGDSEDVKLDSMGSPNSAAAGQQPNGLGNSKSHITVLLLGAGESGKSTLFKQIQFAHGVGIANEEERAELKEMVRLNVIENSRNLIAATQYLNCPIEQPENRETAKIVVNSLTTSDLDDPKWAKKLRDLWKDGGIQKAFANRDQFQLYDSTEYLFEIIDRICTEKYVPTVVDVIRTRTKTLGITDMKFDLEIGKLLRLVDVGGQRNERRKWMHLFSDVDAVVFMTSLSEFDLNCYEDTGFWRVKESLKVFNEVVNNPLFMKIPFVLVLNKRDLFTQKISQKSFSKYFSNFTGDEKNPAHCIDYMTKLFMDEITEHSLDSVTVKTLSAIDFDNTKQVFEEVKQFILDQHKKNHEL